ncbi:STAS domain-containing protein [Kitasatospora sp. LaBMicrA B282]|uniref:STAS domain-containing protein n=1 Tax=Kitasatospora sp. LaBMicrA B282 TaxID=3420949 RepID=UPI003D0DEBDA
MTAPRQPGPGARPLTVEVRVADPGVRVVAPVGDLDRDSAPDLRIALLRAIAGDATTAVVVDCTGLGFCDSSGLNLLLRARLIAEEQNVELRLAAVPGQLARLLDVAGADQVFKVDPQAPPEAAAG